MANHASALKRARQNEKRSERNRAYRTRVRNMIKQVRQAIEAGDAEAAQSALSQAVPIIDKAAGKGIYHRKNAARKISRLSRQVSSL
ncbi:MAG: 30S ribosomal protein S20 [Deltaproteobacteria bacterium]|nr:30S ribosomal protein S20 [Deltaproteobacteria bacterium]